LAIPFAACAGATRRACLGPPSWSRYFKFDTGRWPALQDHWKRIAARPTVQASWKAEGLAQAGTATNQQP